MKTRQLLAIVSLVALAAIAIPGPALDARAVLFLSPLPAPPPNDDFDSAPVIYGLPYSDILDTSEATWAADDPADCSSNGSVWYSFTPATDTMIEANTIGSDYDTALAAYTGTRGALSLVPGACNDDYYGLQSRVSFQATGGTTYYFLVGFCCGDGSNGGGHLEFAVQELEGPANDDFTNAAEVPGIPFSDSLDSSTASLETGEPVPFCAEGHSWGRSVWYVYSPDESGPVTARTEAWFSTGFAVYTGTSLDDLAQIDSGCWGERLTFEAEAGTSYYFQAGVMDGYGDWLTFHLEGPPPNDDFAEANGISGLPYSHSMDNSTATLEPGEPTPSCADPNQMGRTVWYAFTPGESASLWVHLGYGFSPFIGVYTGTSLADLSEVACKWDEDWWPFHVDAGVTYYFQVGSQWTDGGWFAFYLETTPPPVAEFWFSHYEPSVFDTVTFYNYSWDPVNVGLESAAWDFGDGTSSTEWSPSHRYANDGEYTVQLTVTTHDGRSASTSRSLPVHTHDVAITKFSVPKAANAGQTRSIVVGLNSKHQPERVQVELYKSVPGGYEWVGSLVQSVPVRPANRTTDFGFSYTFTADDAQVGKVTFRAVANLIDGWDALPADNEAIAPPTKINR